MFSVVFVVQRNDVCSNIYLCNKELSGFYAARDCVTQSGRPSTTEALNGIMTELPSSNPD